MEKLLKISKLVFGLGFWFSAIGFFSQAYTIIQNQKSEDVSKTMIIIFLLLNINSFVYGKYIAEDKILTWGAFANFIACILIIILMIHHKYF